MEMSRKMECEINKSPLINRAYGSLPSLPSSMVSSDNNNLIKNDLMDDSVSNIGAAPSMISVANLASLKSSPVVSNSLNKQENNSLFGSQSLKQESSSNSSGPIPRASQLYTIENILSSKSTNSSSKFSENKSESGKKLNIFVRFNLPAYHSYFY